MSLWAESVRIGTGRAMWFNAHGGNCFQEAPPVTTSAPAFARRGLFLCGAARDVAGAFLFAAASSTAAPLAVTP
jgi:hypothetical protein